MSVLIKMLVTINREDLHSAPSSIQRGCTECFTMSLATNTHACTHKHTHNTYTHACVCSCMHTCTHAHTHTHTHTHVHTHTPTHTLTCSHRNTHTHTTQKQNLDRFKRDRQLRHSLQTDCSFVGDFKSGKRMNTLQHSRQIVPNRQADVAALPLLLSVHKQKK